MRRERDSTQNFSFFPVFWRVALRPQAYRCRLHSPSLTTLQKYPLSKRTEALRYIDVIERNIQLKRQNIVNAEAAHKTNEQTLRGATSIECEVIKAKFARAMVAHCMGNDDSSFELMKEIIGKATVYRNIEMFDLCMNGVHSLFRHAMEKGGGNIPEPSLFELLLSRLPKTDREKCKLERRFVFRRGSIIL